MVVALVGSVLACSFSLDPRGFKVVCVITLILIDNVFADVIQLRRNRHGCLLAMIRF